MKNVIIYSPHFGENTLRFVAPIMKLPDIQLIGFVDDDDKPYVYNQATLFVYPSFSP